jgi:hypothetical protein
MPAEIKRVSSSFPFHRTVASVKFNHFGNQVLVNYNNDHIYLFDVDKNYSKYVKMKQAIVVCFFMQHLKLVLTFLIIENGLRKS